MAKKLDTENAVVVYKAFEIAKSDDSIANLIGIDLGTEKSLNKAQPHNFDREMAVIMHVTGLPIEVMEKREPDGEIKQNAFASLVGVNHRGEEIAVNGGAALQYAMARGCGYPYAMMNAIADGSAAAYDHVSAKLKALAAVQPYMFVMWHDSKINPRPKSPTKVYAVHIVSESKANEIAAAIDDINVKLRIKLDKFIDRTRLED